MFIDSVYLLVLLFVFLAWLFAASVFSRLTIYEYERGMLFQNGKFRDVLDPGRHWTLKSRDFVQRIDIRENFVTIPAQDVLSADNISIKISLVARYNVEDPERAIFKTTEYHSALYLILQLELRNLVGLTPVDNLLENRKEMGEKLTVSAFPKASEIGIKLNSVDIKDVMFPGELKNIFAKVVSARNEGLAALERARGENAALRKLANTAKLLDKNPSLMQLRILQALGEGTGNSVVLNLVDGETSDLVLEKKGNK